MRLVGRGNQLEGRIEVCHHGIWGTVCDRSWHLQDSAVVCRQLGYSSSGIALINQSLVVRACLCLTIVCHLGATARYNAFYGQGTGPVIIGDIACTGLESSLFDCPNILFGQYCLHSDDVGVVCLPGKCNTVL